MPDRGPQHPGPGDRLLRNAAEVALAVVRRRLAHDPPVPAPRGLVPYLGFARLADRALPAFLRVLEDDEELRRASRDLAEEESVGRASWLFLDRPAGWEEELDRLVRSAGDAAAEDRDHREETELRSRLLAEEEAHRRLEDETARLRRELGEVKELLASERRTRRRAQSDSGRFRRQAGDLASEVADLRQAASQLRLALERREATTDGADEGAGQGAEELFEDAGEHEGLDRQALSAALSQAGAGIDVVAVSLREAARLLAPEVAPAPGTSDPGAPVARQKVEDNIVGSRRRPVPLPPGTFDDSVAAAEHLVRVGRVLVLVDGYNVTKLARPDLTLCAQRAWLVDAAVELAARTGAHLELIFDGVASHGSAPADFGRRLGVQVRFSAESTEADDLILDLVAGMSVARPVVVASNDRRVQDGARRLGANVITSPQLLAVVRRPMGGV